YNILNSTTSITTSIANLRVATFKDELFFKQHSDNHSLIHFAGATLDGRNKYIYTNHYCKFYNICL
ncbi:MAG: hypothetical protein EBZ77_10715, partial [Chitinophagia bacterium]|nr:hypothetical protein [Chitinophagia bacterium]